MEIKTLKILKDQTYPWIYTEKNEHHKQKGEKVGLKLWERITVKTDKTEGRGIHSALGYVAVL